MIDYELGQIVKSKAGRDKDELFIVIEQNDDFLFLSNGTTRRLESLKKKKKKHVQITHLVATDIKDKILTGDKISNADIRNSLKAFRQTLD